MALFVDFPSGKGGCRGVSPTEISPHVFTSKREILWSVVYLWLIGSAALVMLLHG